MSRISLLLILLGFNVFTTNAQTAYSILSDSNGDVSVAEYNSTTNTFSNSFILNSTTLFNDFYPEASYYDPQSQKIIIGSDGGNVSTVDVTTGTVNNQTMPFAYSSGFHWSLYYDHNTQKVYSLLSDSNGDVSVAEYNSTTNTFSNSFSLNSTTLYNDFYPEASYYDPQSQKIIIGSDGGNVSTVDVTTGTVTNQTMPFAYSSGFHWSLYYNTDNINGVQKDNALTVDFSAFPNPCSEYIIVSINGSTVQKLKISLINTTGKVLKTKTISYDTVMFSVTDLPSGVYMIRTEDEYNIMQKIVKL